MATDFNTDDMVTRNGTRVTTVDKINAIKPVQTLPQNGKDLPQQEEPPSEDVENIESAVSKMNEQVQQTHRQLHFSVDRDLDRVVITVTDSATDEVIRQIPSEEALSFAKRFAEGASLEIIDHFA